MGFRSSLRNHTLNSLNRIEEFRMRHPLLGSYGVFAAILAFSPVVFAQASKPSETKKSPAASSAAKHGNSHDLSGVWMQFADGTDPAFARMNGVDDRTRPPLTPW